MSRKREYEHRIRQRASGVTHMTNFPVHTIESAPERSKPALKQLQPAFSMVPDIAGAMATSPVLINCLLGLCGNVHGGSFTEAQVQTVLLTDAVTNASTWAVAFHAALALKEGIAPADVQAIREHRYHQASSRGAIPGLTPGRARSSGRQQAATRSLNELVFLQTGCYFPVSGLSETGRL
jgi:hypothetical protein